MANETDEFTVVKFALLMFSFLFLIALAWSDRFVFELSRNGFGIRLEAVDRGE